MGISNCSKGIFKNFIRVLHLGAMGWEVWLRILGYLFRLWFKGKLGIEVILGKCVFNIKAKLSVWSI